MTFAQISPSIYKLDELKLDSKKSEPVYRYWPVGTDRFSKKNHILYDVQFPVFLAPDYESMQSEEIRHFEPILGKYIVFKLSCNSKQENVHFCVSLLCLE